MSRKTKIITIFLLVVCLMTAILIFGCTNEKVATRTDFALDTVITITLYGQSDEGLLKEPFEEIRALDKKLNVYSADSEISKINAAAGIAPVQVSQDTFDVIREGLLYSQESDGAFDITIGPLVDLWQIGTPKEGVIPSDTDIQAAKALVNYKKVQLNEGETSVYLEDSGMKLNLGAIAKGYIGDKVKDILLSKKIKNAVINLGGNVVLIGGKANKEPVVVGVEDPENQSQDRSQSNDSFLGVLKEMDNTIVTSGDYERYIIGPDGKAYHHILNPVTGYPAESGLHQVTVVTSESTRADALSTTFFVKGLDKSLEYIAKNEGVEAVFVTNDDRVVATEGLNDQFTFDSARLGSQYSFDFIIP